MGKLVGNKVVKVSKAAITMKIRRKAGFIQLELYSME